MGNVCSEAAVGAKLRALWMWEMYRFANVLDRSECYAFRSSWKQIHG